MRPPECGICGRDFPPDEGGLVYFKRRPRDEAWHQRMKEIGGVGHPPEAEWYCGKHYPRARELAHLTRDAAYAILKEEFKDDFP